MLVIDQSSKSTYAYIFTAKGLIAKTQRKFTVIQGLPGYFEFDPEEIFASVLLCMADLAKYLVKNGYTPSMVYKCAIALQRESLVVFDSELDVSLCGVSWSDSRCSAVIPQLQPYETYITERTGLRLDTSLTALKYQFWRQENKFVADSGTVVGTVDTYLLFKLTGRLEQEMSMASRTGYFSAQKYQFDEFLVQLFAIPQGALARLAVLPTVSEFGSINSGPFKGVPIVMVIGDSNAGFLSAHGEAISIAMGYGAFLLSGTKLSNGFSTVLMQAQESRHVYEARLEATTAVLDWLVQVGILESLDYADQLLALQKESAGVFISAALGVITGITLSAERYNFVVAAAEGIAADILGIVGDNPQPLLISGGISKSNGFCQILADVCRRVVIREPQMVARGCYKFICGDCADEGSVRTVFKPSGRDYSRLAARWQEIRRLKEDEIAVQTSHTPSFFSLNKPTTV